MQYLRPYFGQILSQHPRMHCDLSEKIVGGFEKLIYENKLIYSDK